MGAIGLPASCERHRLVVSRNIRNYFRWNARFFWNHLESGEWNVSEFLNTFAVKMGIEASSQVGKDESRLPRSPRGIQAETLHQAMGCFSIASVARWGSRDGSPA